MRELSYSDGSFVLYWTHHALRTDENPALDVARHFADRLQIPLLVYQGISECYPFASDRHHQFMLEGARDLQMQYAELGISYLFHLHRRSCRKALLQERAEHASLIVTEDFPLEPTRGWTERLVAKSNRPTLLVDTACIVPTQIVGRAYDRAYAFREATQHEFEKRVAKPWPKCTLPTRPVESSFLADGLDLQSCNLDDLIAECDIDHAVAPVADTRGGSKAGYARWNRFLENGMGSYAARRNQAEVDGTSRMSAYLHYGMVAPTRLARETTQSPQNDSSRKYLDELLIWRELAYAFCTFRETYEGWDALPAWAKGTLDAHRNDRREHDLSWESCSRAKSSHDLWNAAQRSLIKHGELHNNLRMTWGKAVLHWTSSPEVAMQTLVDLNHRYALDGRDPASYGGILWCFGQFDRPFLPESPIAGTVRSRPLDHHLHRIRWQEYQSHTDRYPFKERLSIGIIGAGLGGLFCARSLLDHGHQVTTFEKSAGFGGRAATRRVESELQFDHGAQYFTIRDPRLAKYSRSWLSDGLIRPWTGRIGEWKDRKWHHESRPCDRFVAVPGMNALGRHLAKDLDVRLRCKIVSVSFESETNARKYWVRDDEGEQFGPFDVLLWNCPPAQILPLLPRDCCWKSQVEGVELRPCWTLMIGLQDRWNVPWDGAFINDGPLKWVARNSSKTGRPTLLDCWVAHSTPEWAEAHLLDDKEIVSDLLWEAFRASAPSEPPEPLFRSTARWRYATPSQGLDCGALWDPLHRLGACGDWCNSARIEGALLSGHSLAGRVMGWMHNSLETVASDGRTSSSARQLDLFDLE